MKDKKYEKKWNWSKQCEKNYIRHYSFMVIYVTTENFIC